MRKYGLVGYPLGHSFSKSYFSDFFSRNRLSDCLYENFAIESIDRIKQILEDYSLQGFNVTIPYKELIIPYLDCMSEQSRAIGAVNCVKIENGRLSGHNTDCYGFKVSLLSMIGSERPAALVLGSGGASKAVRYVLSELGMEYTMVSRTPKGSDIGYDDLDAEIMDSHCLIVNTTPLGMYPKTDAAPAIPYERLSKDHFLFDLVYNPATTKFMELGRRYGAKTMNGADMLRLQAEKSWEIWNEKAE